MRSTLTSGIKVIFWFSYKDESDPAKALKMLSLSMENQDAIPRKGDRILFDIGSDLHSGEVEHVIWNYSPHLKQEPFVNIYVNADRKKDD